MRKKTKLLGGGGREWRRARSWLLQLLSTAELPTPPTPTPSPHRAAELLHFRCCG